MTDVRLTKWGHACVRVQGDAGALVIDPGQPVFTPQEVLTGATAVLVTHTHGDHLDVDRVTSALAADEALVCYGPAAVTAALSAHSGGRFDRQLRTVAAGDTFVAAGLSVSVHGSMHAPIHEDVPIDPNVGFLIEGRIYHPGDALDVYGLPIDVALVPVQAPWSRIGMVVDWLRAVAPRQAIAIHDGMLNDVGLGSTDRMLGGGVGLDVGCEYRRLAPGETVTV